MPTPAQIPSDHLQPVIELARRAARFWRAGLAVLLVSLLATAAGAKLRPRHYKSEAVLYYREGMQWNPNETASTRRIGQRLRDILLSRTQLTAVIEELGLYPQLVRAGRTEEAVEEMLLVTTFKVTEGDIFVVSYTGDTPAQAQRVTAKLTEVVIEENTRLRASQAEVAQAFLDVEKRRNADELAARETEQVRFLAKHPEFLHEPGATTATLRAVAGPKPQEGDLALSALRREEQRLRRLIASPSKPPRAPQAPAALVAARDEAAAKLATTERELADRRARFTEQHPDVRSAAAMVKLAEAALRRATEAVEAAEAAVPPVDLEGQLRQVQQDITARQTQGKPSTPAASGGSDPAQRIVALETEWARLSREVAEARERLQALDSRQFGAAMTLSTLLGGQAAQIVVIDPAYLPAKPVGMSLTRFLVLGLMATLAASVGVAVALGLADDRLHTAADVERLELSPVLAEIELGGPPREGREPGGRLGGRRARSLPGRRIAEGGVPPRGASGPEHSLPDASAAAAGRGAPGEGAGPGGERPPPARSSSPRGASVSTATSLARAAPGARELAVASEAAAALAASAGGGPGLVRVRPVEPVPGTDPRVVMLAAPDSPMAAGYRVLRHRLAPRARGKAILVTSPSPGEGRTLCALNLALALGEGGQAQVLLLEANFRAPALSQLLGFDPPACIGRQLESHRAPRAHAWDVAETAVPWLHAAVVARGAEPRPVPEGPALPALVEDARRAGYDYVVVDGPPVLGSADVNVIEEGVDGILVVLRAGSTRTRDLRRAAEQIGRTKLLGFALLRS
jgi:Mrp family chromosome partitioning ATPase